MNDLVEYLKSPYVLGERHASPGELVDQMLSKMKEAADHIESQNKLIAEMREAYEHYELALATREHGVVAMGRLVAAIASIYSKSNPNTPERNDE